MVGSLWKGFEQNSRAPCNIKGKGEVSPAKHELFPLPLDAFGRKFVKRGLLA
jgi:hypothetical protein